MVNLKDAIEVSFYENRIGLCFLLTPSCMPYKLLNKKPSSRPSTKSFLIFGDIVVLKVSS